MKTHVLCNLQNIHACQDALTLQVPLQEVTYVVMHTLPHNSTAYLSNFLCMCRHSWLTLSSSFQYKFPPRLHLILTF